MSSNIVNTSSATSSTTSSKRGSETSSPPSTLTDQVEGTRGMTIEDYDPDEGIQETPASESSPDRSGEGSSGAEYSVAEHRRCVEAIIQFTGYDPRAMQRSPQRPIIIQPNCRKASGLSPLVELMEHVTERITKQYVTGWSKKSIVERTAFLNVFDAEVTEMVDQATAVLTAIKSRYPERYKLLGSNWATIERLSYHVLRITLSQAGNTLIQTETWLDRCNRIIDDNIVKLAASIKKPKIKTKLSAKKTSSKKRKMPSTPGKPQQPSLAPSPASSRPSRNRNKPNRLVDECSQSGTS